MAELFKNIYTKKFINEFSDLLIEVIPYFNKESFIKTVFNQHWKELELKERMRHLSHSLNSHINENFKNQTNYLMKVVSLMKEKGIKETSIEFMFIPDFIEVYGINHYNTAIKAIESITQFTSCEFAVRPFILKYPKKMITQMKNWVQHKHPMVRRLATEGCRPRLPWAMALPFLKKNPTIILPILEFLKEDSSESVRRSVANNLNDISKDNPKIVIKIAKQWKGKTKELDWVVKHACRTLLKQGMIEVMELFRFGKINDLKIDSFTIHTPIVKIGNHLEFSFNLQNISKQPIKLRLEYGLYYQKANGTLSKKVFKISEKTYLENSITKINRKQSFKIITTRKFYSGKHQVSLILNGIELEQYDFTLN